MVDTVTDTTSFRTADSAVSEYTSSVSERE